MNQFNPYDSQETYSFSEGYDNVHNLYEVNDSYLTEDFYRPQMTQQGVGNQAFLFPPFGPPPARQQQIPPFGPPSGGQQQMPPFGPPSGGQQQMPPFGPPSGGQQQMPPFGPPSGGQQQMPPFGPPSGGQQQMPPFGPPSGGQQQMPPFGPPPAGQQHTPPFGPPPAGQQHHDEAPTAPPPSFVPQLTSVSTTAIDAPSMRRCLYQNTYVWLMNGRSFWFYPTYVGRTSVAGYRWSPSRRRWAYFGIDAREIRSFQCF